MKMNKLCKEKVACPPKRDRHGTTCLAMTPEAFYDAVIFGGSVIKVQADFLSGEYEGTGKKHGTRALDIISS